VSAEKSTPKKTIKRKPRHPRPSKDLRWGERREAKPRYKKARKRAKELEKDRSE